MNDSEEDNESDLDMDIYELARRPCTSNNPSTSTAAQPQENTEIEIEDEEMPMTDNSTEVPSRSIRYGLRRKKSPVGYQGMDFTQDSEDEKDEDNSFPKKGKTRNILYLATLYGGSAEGKKLLQKLLRDPESAEKLSMWVLSVKDVQGCATDDSEYMKSVEKVIKTCTQYMDQLVVHCEDIGMTLNSNFTGSSRSLILAIFKTAKFLRSLYIRYDDNCKNIPSQVSEILQLLLESGQKSVNSLKIMGNEGHGVVVFEEINLITALSTSNGIKWSRIELGNCLLVKEGFQIGESLRDLLEAAKDSLESLVLHGGCMGKSNLFEGNEKVSLSFPRRMSRIEKLKICPVYNFVSPEVRNPASKRWREIRLDCGNENEEVASLKPINMVLILDTTDFPNLKEVVLGNVVEIKEFGIGFIRKLNRFQCGSRWDLAINFPKVESKKGPSQLKQMQLPDGLKDPTFIRNVAKFFPMLEKAWIFLPSVAVLRTFFKCYESSENLRELILKIQFDFETTLESCLLPKLKDRKNKLSEASKTALEMLRGYKHFEQYVRYHNIELPLESQEDIKELRRTGAGIRALKSLKVLVLEHIPRTILVPNPEDTRHWSDYNFKYYDTTFGFQRYPFSKKCHREILGMDLQKYLWHNFDIPNCPKRDFEEAGYVSDETGFFDSDEDDNLFIRVPKDQSSPSRKRGQGTKITIKPSMLLQNHFRKDKQEN